MFASHARRYAHAQRLPFIYAFKPRPLYRALNLSGSEQESALGNRDEKISELSSRFAHASGGQGGGVFEHPNHPPGYATDIWRKLINLLLYLYVHTYFRDVLKRD